MKKRRANELPLNQVIRKSTGEKLSLAASISDAFDLSKLLIHREIIPAGKKTAPIHKHSHKEEAFYVESGEPSLWYEGKAEALSAGDVVGFKSSDGMRMIFNDSSREAVVWTIGTKDLEDVVEYFDEVEGR